MRTMPLNSVFDRMVTLSRAMDQSFSANSPEGATAGVSQQYWVPALDAYEIEDAFVAQLDLPGVRAEDVELSFERNTLTVTGQRIPSMRAPEQGELRVFLAERSSGTFTRSLRFPQYVEGEKIEASFQDGVLTVTVPKAAAAKPRKIAISQHGSQQNGNQQQQIDG